MTNLSPTPGPTRGITGGGSHRTTARAGLRNSSSALRAARGSPTQLPAARPSCVVAYAVQIRRELTRLYWLLQTDARCGDQQFGLFVLRKTVTTHLGPDGPMHLHLAYLCGYGSRELYARPLPNGPHLHREAARGYRGDRGYAPRVALIFRAPAAPAVQTRPARASWTDTSEPCMHTHGPAAWSLERVSHARAC